MNKPKLVNEEMPTIPASGGTVEEKLVSHPVVEPSSIEETHEELKVEEALASENSEVVETTEAVSDTPTIEDTYGGAWGIIKHTGYLQVLAWAIASAIATGAAAFFFTPPQGNAWIALSVLGFMTGVIAAVDRKTRLIKNKHTILTAILTVPLSVWVAFNLGPWNILFGLGSALAIFGVFIFLVIKVNFGSGGDIKFAPVPAFALGVVNPLIAALWLFYALIVTVILLVINKQKKTSFGEGMVISLPLAIMTVCGLYTMAGLPYLHPAVF